MAMTFKFAADGSQYKRGLEKMRGQTKAFAGGVTKMMGAMFAGGALVGLKLWGDSLDRISKLAKRLNTTTDEIQKMGHAAKLSGNNIEEFANAVVKSQRKAAEGTDTTKKAFDELGISMSEYMSLSPTEALTALERGFISVGGGARGLSLLFKVAEDDAKKLTQSFNDAGTGMADSFNEANLVTANTIKNVEKLNDQVTGLKNTMSGWLSWLFDALSAFSVVAGAVVIGWVGIWMGAFKAIGDGAAATGNAILNGLTGNFDEAKKNLDQMKNAFTGFYKNIKKQVADTDSLIVGAVGDIYGVGDRTPQKKNSTLTGDGKKGIDTGVMHGPKNQTPAEATAAAADAASKLEDRYSELDNELGHILDRAEPPTSEAAGKKRSSTSIVASSLASIGGGGGTGAFSSDPALSEAKKQTTILETIATNTMPPGGTPVTPEL